MAPKHYILIPNGQHSTKIIQLIKNGQLIEGKSYSLDRTPTIYDLNSGIMRIENKEFEESFTTLQNWRNIQICKLTNELPNQHIIEYINYLTTSQ